MELNWRPPWIVVLFIIIHVGADRRDYYLLQTPHLFCSLDPTRVQYHEDYILNPQQFASGGISPAEDGYGLPGKFANTRYDSYFSNNPYSQNLPEECIVVNTGIPEFIYLPYNNGLLPGHTSESTGSVDLYGGYDVGPKRNYDHNYNADCRPYIDYRSYPWETPFKGNSEFDKPISQQEPISSLLHISPQDLSKLIHSYQQLQNSAPVQFYDHDYPPIYSHPKYTDYYYTDLIPTPNYSTKPDFNHLPLDSTDYFTKIVKPDILESGSYSRKILSGVDDRKENSDSEIEYHWYIVRKNFRNGNDGMKSDVDESSIERGSHGTGFDKDQSDEEGETYEGNSGNYGGSDYRKGSSNSGIYQKSKHNYGNKPESQKYIGGIHDRDSFGNNEEKIYEYSTDKPHHGDGQYPNTNHQNGPYVSGEYNKDDTVINKNIKVDLDQGNHLQFEDSVSMDGAPNLSGESLNPLDSYFTKQNGYHSKYSGFDNKLKSSDSPLYQGHQNNNDVHSTSGIESNLPIGSTFVNGLSNEGYQINRNYVSGDLSNGEYQPGVHNDRTFIGESRSSGNHNSHSYRNGYPSNGGYDRGSTIGSGLGDESTKDSSESSHRFSSGQPDSGRLLTGLTSGHGLGDGSSKDGSLSSNRRPHNGGHYTGESDDLESGFSNGGGSYSSSKYSGGRSHSGGHRTGLKSGSGDLEDGSSSGGGSYSSSRYSGGRSHSGGHRTGLKSGSVDLEDGSSSGGGSLSSSRYSGERSQNGRQRTDLTSGIGDLEDGSSNGGGSLSSSRYNSGSSHSGGPYTGLTIGSDDLEDGSSNAGGSNSSSRYSGGRSHSGRHRTGLASISGDLEDGSSNGGGSYSSSRYSGERSHRGRHRTGLKNGSDDLEDGSSNSGGSYSSSRNSGGHHAGSTSKSGSGGKSSTIFGNGYVGRRKYQTSGGHFGDGSSTSQSYSNDHLSNEDHQTFKLGESGLGSGSLNNGGIVYGGEHSSSGGNPNSKRSNGSLTEDSGSDESVKSNKAVSESNKPIIIGHSNSDELVSTSKTDLPDSDIHTQS